MNERNWVKERVLHQSWETLERRFYDQWIHGTLWCIAGFIGLLAALVAARGWAFVSGRLALAALVLGVGIGTLKALSLLRMVQNSPQAFLSIFTGAGSRCCAPLVRRYTVYLGLMEGGFVLLECLVLFGLLGLSTTVATIPMDNSERWSLAIILWVYGFFAITFGSKSITNALTWSYWLRPRLEKALNWQGANWLLASGRWTLTRFNLLRPEAHFRPDPNRLVLMWRGLFVFLVLMVAVFALTLAALTLSR
ncbi:MAG: hypothetical protein N3B10_01535 [Armatimonadetes bacterium]|nr:hypothetical protein [Armatimonadota bacterium]MCX7967149.1 hypothetical protein [Armatimonadota bacterium]MDW8141951.1 hypothetical protein [Armatimonadota bacterium]